MAFSFVRRIRGRRLLTGALALALAVALGGSAACPGCREAGGNRSAGFGNGKGGKPSGLSLGELIFRMVRISVEQSPDNPQGKVAALDAREADFIAAVDAILPPSFSSNVHGTLDEILALVDDGTLPDLSAAMASVLDLIADDPADPQGQRLHGLAALANARVGVDFPHLVRLGGRLMSYAELDRLLDSITTLLRENDGVDAAGAPNGERDLLGELFGVLSRRLAALDYPDPSNPGLLERLTDALLAPAELRGGLQVGGPAFSIRLDRKGNPKVAVDPATARIYWPFVDADVDGAADTDVEGRPVDSTGLRSEIPAFVDPAAAPPPVPPGSVAPAAIARDPEGMALAHDGRYLYEYFDVKRTALGQTLIMAGDLLRQDVTADLLAVLEGLAVRELRTDPATGATYEVFASDNPATDLAWALLEIFKYRDAPKLLESLAALLRQDPLLAEALMVKLVDVVNLLRMAQFSQAPDFLAILDDLVPLLDETFEQQGTGGVSAGRMLLDVFRTEIQRVRTIPAGLATMMKYSDYATRTPVGPGQISSMEKVLNMMEEANHCDSWPFGNMAEFYLDAMAGNKSILGFNISVYTVNQLIAIPFLRNLLCSNISAANVQALQDFATTGALDSLIPIVKVFSDRGQTLLVKDIFLALQRNYATKLRPIEPTVVEILESGAVETLFDAVNLMTSMRVPSTGEPVPDVIADFASALVDDDQPVLDRLGRAHPSLLQLVTRSLKAVSDRLESRGAGPAATRLRDRLLDTCFAIAINDNGTPANGLDDWKQLKFHALIPHAAAALDASADSLSIFPWDRVQQVNGYQQDLVALMTGRDLVVIADVLAAIERSSGRQDVLNAIVNLFTPNVQARHDVFGAILEIAPFLMQSGSDPDPAARNAKVDAMRFFGRVLDPSRPIARGVTSALVKLLSSSQGGTMLEIARNALDKGPNGDQRAPVETLKAILDEVKAQGQAAGLATADSVRQGAIDTAVWIRDADHGLEAIYNLLRNRK